MNTDKTFLRDTIKNALSVILFGAFYLAGYFTSYLSTEQKIDEERRIVAMLTLETNRQQSEIDAQKKALDELNKRAMTHTSGLIEITNLKAEIQKLAARVTALEVHK